MLGMKRDKDEAHVFPVWVNERHGGTGTLEETGDN